MPVFTTVECSEGHAPECTLSAASSRAARLKEETGDRNSSCELDDESLVSDMSMVSLQVMTARSEAARPASTGGQTKCCRLVPKTSNDVHKKENSLYKKTEYCNIPFNIAQFCATFV